MTDLKMGRIEFGKEASERKHQRELNEQAKEWMARNFWDAKAVESFDLAVASGWVCYDCHLPYGGNEWVEAVVPDDVWEQIKPQEGQGAGILCINCMAKRCAKMGLENVPVKLTAGPFVVQS
jgi:hypothetical protein